MIKSVFQAFTGIKIGFYQELGKVFDTWVAARIAHQLVSEKLKKLGNPRKLGKF